jgi:AcrR family transcriptional regulator
MDEYSARVTTDRIDRRARMADTTRREILETARRLFAERGYVGTSIADIAHEAGVAVQTIYARLGSKHAMLIALIDLIDEEAGVGEAAARVVGARTPRETVRAEVRLTRRFQERSGDIIGALFAAAGAEPDLADAVAEGRLRHRTGARLAVERIDALGGLRSGLSIDDAAAIITVTTTHEAWTELTQAFALSWDQAEELVVRTLEDAILNRRRRA